MFTEPIVEIGRKSDFEPARIILRLKLNDVEDSILRKDVSVALRSLIPAVRHGIWKTQLSSGLALRLARVIWRTIWPRLSEVDIFCPSIRSRLITLKMVCFRRPNSEARSIAEMSLVSIADSLCASR